MAVYQISYDLQKQIITLRVTTESIPAEPNSNVMISRGSLLLAKLLHRLVRFFWSW